MYHFEPLKLVVLAFCLIVAACGPLPKPFKSGAGAGAEHPFLAMQDSAGVVVAPLVGAPPAVSGPLAEIMAAALRREDIPATTGSAIKNAYLLEGEAGLPRSPNGAVSIAWSLSDARGAVVESLTTEHRVHPAAWRAGATDMLEALAAAAAPVIARTLQVNLPAVAARDRPTLGVVAVEGAPGNGNTALRAAFEAVLRGAGLPVAADPRAATVQIFGAVEVTPLAAGKEAGKAKVRIKWKLRDAKGNDIGVLNQSNTVESRRLVGQWGSLAYDVTYAMVDSVARMLRAIDDAERIRLR